MTSEDCYCSVIDGRRFLCDGCAKELRDELEDLKRTNKQLQDELEELAQKFAEQRALTYETQHERDLNYDDFVAARRCAEKLARRAGGEKEVMSEAQTRLLLMTAELVRRALRHIFSGELLPKTHYDVINTELDEAIADVEEEGKA